MHPVLRAARAAPPRWRRTAAFLAGAALLGAGLAVPAAIPAAAASSSNASGARNTQPPEPMHSTPSICARHFSPVPAGPSVDGLTPWPAACARSGGAIRLRVL